MELLNQTKFAAKAKVSKMAISKALKNKRLEYCDGSKKIDVDSPLSQAFLNNISPQRMSNVLNPTGGVLQLPNPGELSTYIPDNAEAIAGTVEDYGKEKTKVAKETAIKLNLSNTTTRGHLLEYDLVEQYIFLWIDTLHSNLDRMSGGFWDDLARRLILAGENLPEFKLEWNDKIKLIKHETKLAAMERLVGIKKIQAEG